MSTLQGSPARHSMIVSEPALVFTTRVLRYIFLRFTTSPLSFSLATFSNMVLLPRLCVSL